MVAVLVVKQNLVCGVSWHTTLGQNINPLNTGVRKLWLGQLAENKEMVD